MHNQLIGSQYCNVHALWVVDIGVLCQLPEGFKQYSPADADAARAAQQSRFLKEQEDAAREEEQRAKTKREREEELLQMEADLKHMQEQEAQEAELNKPKEAEGTDAVADALNDDDAAAAAFVSATQLVLITAAELFVKAE